jgi:hypothetical protein
MWLGNHTGGPSGLGRWGDRFMVGNRGYTVRISIRYFVILALVPLEAGVLLIWSALT